MPEPERLVLLVDEHQNEFLSVAEPNLEALRKQLVQNNKNIRRLEDSITKKREQLSELSHSLDKQIQKQLYTKTRQSSFFDVMRISDANPKLKEIHENILKADSQIQQTKRKLEQMRRIRESGPNQQAESITATMIIKKKQVEKLDSERDTLAIQLKRLQTEINIQNPIDTKEKAFQQNVDTLRKEVKQFEKDIHVIDKDSQFYDLYTSYLYLQMEEIEKRAQSRKLKIDPNELKQEIQLIQSLTTEKLAYEKKAAQQLNAKARLSEVLETMNNQLKKKTRQVYNVVLRSELNISKTTNKRITTQRTYSSNNLKITGKQEVSERKRSLISPIVKPQFDMSDKFFIRIGNTQDSSKGIWMNDKPITQDPTTKLIQITVFQSQKHILCGFQLKYLINNAVVAGKKLLSSTSTTLQQRTFPIESISSLTLLFDEKLITAITVMPFSGQSQTVGLIGPGISRVISLNEFHILSVDVKLQTQDEIQETAIVGLIFGVEKKMFMKKNTTMPLEPTEYIEQDIQISNELQSKNKQRLKGMSSHKNLIYKGQLPKLNTRIANDYKLRIWDEYQRK